MQSPDVVDHQPALNFETHALAIGIDRDGKAPWLELDADDWRALHLALTKTLPGMTSSIAEAFPALGQVAAVAAQAEAYLKRRR